MTPIARISAALEILTEIDTRRRPASDVMKEWGINHRFAGSKDRSAIGLLVFDAFRVKAAAQHIMKAETPRANLLGSLALVRKLSVAEIDALMPKGERFAAPALDEDERAALAACDLSDAPDFIKGNYPKWLDGQFHALFGENAVAEGQAMAARAPVDLRVNTLKATRYEVLGALAHLNVTASPLSPWGIRIPVSEDGRGPALQAEPSFALGHVEVQDEGSQVAALLSGAKPDMHVLDLCAGGGGKTLALAAMMQNKGKLIAADSDGRRLMPIFDRLTRAGVTNVEVRNPKGKVLALEDLHNTQDIVFVDAPCSGSGTWRRNPDSKWRLRQPSLSQRLDEQDQVLVQAAEFVKSGGKLVYVTCSLLREENEDRVSRFLRQNGNFTALDPSEMTAGPDLAHLQSFASRFGAGLRLTPLSAGTDGFYIAVLRRDA